MIVSELGNLPLLARIAYAVMCFERFAAFAYPDTDFAPVTEMMWRIADGKQPAAEAAEQFLDAVPEKLFAYRSYEAYKAAGHSSLTEEQYRDFTRILNPDDRALSNMMMRVYQIATAYKGRTVQPGLPEIAPYLENMAAMLEHRSVTLPDPAVLEQYAFTLGELRDKKSIDWTGRPVDAAPLTLFRFAEKAAAGAVRAAEPESSPTPIENPGSKYGAVFETFSNRLDSIYPKNGTRNGALPFTPTFPSSVSANGCEWEVITGADGCIITRCVNSSGLKEVTVPSELNGKTVIAVGDDAFSNDAESRCRLIETIIMADTIRQIGSGFFKGCIYLRRITMPAQLESIGNDAFRGASALERLVIGDKCRTIGNHFCADAISLQNVTIGTGIESIGQYTFYNTPAMLGFSCGGELRMLGYGSFWMNKWADSIIFNSATEMLRFGRNNSLLYRYVRKTPPQRLFIDETVRYVYDFAFGGDAWNCGGGITDIYLPGAEIIGVNAFKKTPNATVHLSASRMKESYGPDYEYTLAMICVPAKIVFDQP
ncbi:MAG: leucine-rich repeat domain-containing protein [Oscillospiraceae bacterium]|nr:leucine-rich repeat domain-containing protein [Oscillospiraceae bacterium]